MHLSHGRGIDICSNTCPARDWKLPAKQTVPRSRDAMRVRWAALPISPSSMLVADTVFLAELGRANGTILILVSTM
jgi:hypothetical protein